MQCQKEKLESGMKMTMLVDILQRMDILSYVRNMGLSDLETRNAFR